mmetsp:Transcript_66144/g.173422  ORF Transcript_66144/g.173422 Transcript_66144/m.173422 type:complete len:940 (-) Transcript_66144:220-3039(-)
MLLHGSTLCQPGAVELHHHLPLVARLHGVLPGLQKRRRRVELRVVQDRQLQGRLLEAVLLLPDLAPVLAGVLAQGLRRVVQGAAEGLLPGLELLLAHVRDAAREVLHGALDERHDRVRAFPEALHEHADLHDGGVRGDVAEDDVAQLVLGPQGLEDRPIDELAQHREVDPVRDVRDAKLVRHERRGVGVLRDGVGDADLHGLLRLENLQVAVVVDDRLRLVDAEQGLDLRRDGLRAIPAEVPREEEREVRVPEDLVEEPPVGVQVHQGRVLRRLEQLRAGVAALHRDDLKGLEGVLVRLQLRDVGQVQVELAPRHLELRFRAPRAAHPGQHHLDQLEDVLVEAHEGDGEAILARADRVRDAAGLHGVRGLLEHHVDHARVHGRDDGVLHAVDDGGREAKLDGDDGLGQLDVPEAQPPGLRAAVRQQLLRRAAGLDGLADERGVPGDVRKVRRGHQAVAGGSGEALDELGLDRLLLVPEVVVLLVRVPARLVEGGAHQGDVHVVGPHVLQDRHHELFVRRVDEDATREEVLRRVARRGTRQGAHKVELRGLLLLVVELHLAQLLHAGNQVHVDPGGLSCVDVREEVLQHLLRVLQALLCEGEGHHHRGAGDGVLSVVAVGLGQVLLEQQRLQTPRAVVAQDVPDVGLGKLLVVRLQRGQGHRDPHLRAPAVVHSVAPAEVAELVGELGLVRVHGARGAALRRDRGERVEVLVRHLQVLGDGAVGDQHEVQATGAVVLAVEILQGLDEALPLALGLRLERLQVAGGELGHRVQRVCLGPQQVPQAALRVRLVLLVLRVHRVDLLVDHRGIQRRGNEELGENVERLVDAFVADLVVVDRLLGRRVGVVVAAVERQLRGVLLGVRKLLGAKENHVLQEMREALEVLRVLQRASLDGNREAGLLGLRVVYDENLEPGLERRVMVLALVRQGLPDLGCPVLESHG